VLAADAADPREAARHNDAAAGWIHNEAMSNQEIMA